jgi:hypothetical protein
MVTVERLTALTDQWLAAEPEWVVFGSTESLCLSPGVYPGIWVTKLVTETSGHNQISLTSFVRGWLCLSDMPAFPLLSKTSTFK